MRRRRHVTLLALSLLLAVSSCDVQLTSFRVPAQGLSGAVFEVRIDASISATSGAAGCVLQLPNGFSVVGFTTNSPQDVFANTPGVSAIYTPEPGMHLESFSGGGSKFSNGLAGILQVFVRPAPGVTGTFPIKVALTGNNLNGWIAQDPPQTQFALINDAAHRKTIAIVPAPFAPFAFDSEGLPISSGTPVHAWAAASCGDIDHDGKAEIIVTNTSAGLRHFRSLPRALSGGPGTLWSEQPQLLGSLISTRTAIADLDLDGALDVVLGSGVPLFGIGALWIVGNGFPVLQSGSDSVAVGDVDHDGLPDVALGGHTSKTLQVLLNNGNRTFRDSSTGLPNLPGQPTTRDTVLFADLDGDGNLDLFWSTAFANFAFLGDGHGGWTAATLPPFPSEGDAVAIDIDGDGALEIVNARGAVIRYAGNNSFALVSGTGLTAFAGSWIEALDFDRDGDMDLALANVGLELWANDGLGHFARLAASGLPDGFVGNIVDLAIGDIDGNSWPDLVVTVDGAGVFAFQNLRTGVAPFGAGCSGAGVQVPALQAIGAPTRGNTAFALQLHCNVGSVLGGFWFDGDRGFFGSVPLPLDLAGFGAPGCALLVSPTFLHLGLIDAAGNLTIALPVPATPALARLTLFGQGCACVPTANPAGSVLTAGVAIRID
jgi:hypothetical protein